MMAGSNMVGASREAPDVPRYEEGIKQASEGVLMGEQDIRGKRAVQEPNFLDVPGSDLYGTELFSVV